MKTSTPTIESLIEIPAVLFTNNDAERGLHMMKCKQKISGGFRSDNGYDKKVKGIDAVEVTLSQRTDNKIPVVQCNIIDYQKFMQWVNSQSFDELKLPELPFEAGQ